MSEKSTLSKPAGSGTASSAAIIGRRLWPYIQPLLGTLIAGIAAMAVVAATEAGIPALLKPLLDHGFGSSGSPVAKKIVPIAIIGLALVRGVAQYSSGYLLQYVSNKILLELRLKMFERMIHASVGFFQRETASTIINAIVFEV
ncbi:MAG TPA: ABC transporter transmembrane domain-containing protein, partial [Paraburkholderia sp.]